MAASFLFMAASFFAVSGSAGSSNFLALSFTRRFCVSNRRRRTSSSQSVSVIPSDFSFIPGGGAWRLTPSVFFGAVDFFLPMEAAVGAMESEPAR